MSTSSTTSSSAIYFALVVTIGVLARRAIATSEDFLLSGRSLPAWVTGLAFISANLGAIEILGHGRQRRAVRHLDRALLLDRRRAGDGLPRPGDDAVLLRLAGPQRARSSCCAGSTRPPTCSTRSRFAAAAVLIAGVNLYALALVIKALIGWPIWLSIIVSARLRARLHHPRRAVRRDLQRGAAVLRDHRRPGPAGDHRAARTSAAGAACRTRSTTPSWAARLLDLGRHARRALDATRSATGSASSWASASCCRSATGRRTSPRCSARCRPRTCRPPSARR